MSKVKLNQIVALNSPKKAEFQKFLTKYYQIMQKSEPFFGMERVYTPKDDDGEKLPTESSKVQLNVDDLLSDITTAWQQMFDVVLTNDSGNAIATADVIVDDLTILSNVPISTLLFLEKQLTDLKTVIDKIPVLPLSENWSKDAASNLWVTPVHQTVRTKKVQKPIVLYDATKEHPAQTQLITEDINVGTWSVKRLSSALSQSEVEDLHERIVKLREAVIKAREQANSIEIDQKKGGNSIMNYLFEH